MAFFFQIEALLSLKNVWLPLIFFLDTTVLRALAKFCFLLIVLNRAKLNIPVLVGTTHRKLEYHEMRRTYMQ